MRKILSAEHQEIFEFFKSRGENCVKITLSNDDESITEYYCLVITQTGKKEKVSIRIQKTPPTKQTACAACGF